MEYLLIILHPRLIIGVDVSQCPFVGDGEEEEVHKRPHVEGGELFHRDMAAHAPLGSQGFLIYPSRGVPACG